MRDYENIFAYLLITFIRGILASSGYPIIKSRLAKPLLIELVKVSPLEWYDIHDALALTQLGLHLLMPFYLWASLTVFYSIYLLP